MIYTLITVIEREILSETFATYKEAFATMRKELYEQIRKHPDEEDDFLSENDLIEGADNGRWGLDKYCAYSNCDDDNNWDWRIIETNGVFIPDVEEKIKGAPNIAKMISNVVEDDIRELRKEIHQEIIWDLGSDSEDNSHNYQSLALHAYLGILLDVKHAMDNQ